MRLVHLTPFIVVKKVVEGSWGLFFRGVILSREVGVEEVAKVG